MCTCEAATESRLQTYRAKAVTEGSCNFCNRQVGAHGTRRDATVTVVRSPGNMTVRFCDACLAELKHSR